VLAAGCVGSPSTTESADTPAIVTTVVIGTSDERDAHGVVDEAVDALLDAGSYAFEVHIALVVGAETIESELDGWVDGADRELRLQVGNEAVVTRVIDGVATIERNDNITAIPLERADRGPSLEVLRSLDQIIMISPTELVGVLDASHLEGTGFSAGGAADVVLYLAANGALSGYRMESGDKSWTVRARFSDAGESFAG